METKKRLEFHGSQFFSLIPFVVFIVTSIYLSFKNAADLNMMIGAAVVGLLIGMIFAKDANTYWASVLRGLGSTTGMSAVMLWLIVGIYGNILQEGSIVEGLVWLGIKVKANGSVFTVLSFLFSAIFAMATGSGFGTISTMSFILYPAGILLGSNPAVLAGAILSGAAFGDSLAPVSDTTIVAATSQEYNYKKGTAEIGGTVRTRAKYVIIAGIIAAVLFFFFGAKGTSVNSAQAQKLLSQYQNPKGLLLLIPTALVIALSVKGVNIYKSLGCGILAAIFLGIPSGLFEFGDLISFEEGAVTGAIPNGVAGMTTVCILLISVVAMGNLLIESGCMEQTVNWLNENVIKTARGAELAIFFLASIFGILIAAINTIANICVAPFVNAIGKKHNLHPYRRANILATAICSFPFFLPYGGCVLLLLGGLTNALSTYPFLPTLAASDMMFTAFYSWVIWILMLIVCLTGWGRSFEKKDGSGEEVKQSE